MTVKCMVCGTLSKERKQPLKFLVLRAYYGKHGEFWYFCSLECLKAWLEDVMRKGTSLIYQYNLGECKKEIALNPKN